MGQREPAGLRERQKLGGYPKRRPSINFFQCKIGCVYLFIKYCFNVPRGVGGVVFTCSAGYLINIDDFFHDF